jgi:hypothetical protein
MEDGASFDGAESCKQQLFALTDIAGNGTCAECSARSPDWVSLKHGAFICFHCAEVYVELGILPVKSIYLDSFDLTEVMVCRKLVCEFTLSSNW